MLQDFNSNTFKSIILKFLTPYIPKVKLDMRAKLPNTDTYFACWKDGRANIIIESPVIFIKKKKVLCF